VLTWDRLAAAVAATSLNLRSWPAKLLSIIFLADGHLQESYRDAVARAVAVAHGVVLDRPNHSNRTSSSKRF